MPVLAAMVETAALALAAKAGMELNFPAPTSAELFSEWEMVAVLQAATAALGLVVLGATVEREVPAGMAVTEATRTRVSRAATVVMVRRMGLPQVAPED
jgi:hypothetical protein